MNPSMLIALDQERQKALDAGDVDYHDLIVEIILLNAPAHPLPMYASEMAS